MAGKDPLMTMTRRSLFGLALLPVMPTPEPVRKWYLRRDDVAGLPLRYTMKLLAPVPVKGIGRTSLGPLLGALGLKLVVAVDHEVLARIRPRLIGRHHASLALLPVGKPRQKAYTINSTEVSLLYNERRTLKLSPSRRSSIARIAAKARWGGVKVIKNR